LAKKSFQILILLFFYDNISSKLTIQHSSVLFSILQRSLAFFTALDHERSSPFFGIRFSALCSVLQRSSALFTAL
jgi:hypothetical protein